MDLHEQAMNSSGLRMPELGKRGIRKVNMVQLGRALTDPTMDPPIRALFVYSSNPATTAPNQELVLQGLRRDDLFTVVHEQFLDRVRPGVVAMPSGWWASRSPGGSSANALTPDGLTLWGGGGDFHDALVEVEPVTM
jgi:anaerobic selenocysteine-containing dehydrogenase